MLPRFFFRDYKKPSQGSLLSNQYFMESQAVFFFRGSGGKANRRSYAVKQGSLGAEGSLGGDDQRAPSISVSCRIWVTSVSLSTLIQKEIVFSQKHETFYNWGSFFKNLQTCCMLMLFGSRWCRPFIFLLVVGCVPGCV